MTYVLSCVSLFKVTNHAHVLFWYPDKGDSDGELSEHLLRPAHCTGYIDWLESLIRIPSEELHLYYAKDQAERESRGGNSQQEEPAGDHPHDVLYKLWNNWYLARKQKQSAV